MTSVFIIAEIGVNHNGDVGIAKKLIDSAKSAGADAVKFQTFKAEKLVTERAEKANYQKENDSRHKNQFEMLKALELTEEQHYKLKEYCEEAKIKFLSTPFDEESANFLEELGVDSFKVSSGDLTNLPFLIHLAKKKLPIIISTGMSEMFEIEAAVKAIEENGNPELSILHCLSNYPADTKECNLLAIKTIREKFGKKTGWSDHTDSDLTAIMSVALGAEIIEKHITLDKNMEGPDHKASADIEEFQKYVKLIRQAEKAMGDGVKRIQPSESNTAKVAKKSLTARRDIEEGEILSEDNVICLRPGDGISPIKFSEVFGKKALHAISKDEQIKFDNIG
jgi:N-acetylneuraminate synthase